MIHPQEVSRDGLGGAGAAEDAPAHATVVASDDEAELDPTLRALLASIVGHPELPRVVPMRLGEEERNWVIGPSRHSDILCTNMADVY